jgi:hypothetical protein
LLHSAIHPENRQCRFEGLRPSRPDRQPSQQFHDTPERRRVQTPTLQKTEVCAPRIVLLYSIRADARPSAGTRPCDTLQETYMAPDNNDKNDASALSHIDRLVKEEEQLYGKSEISSEDRARLADLKVHLDQCWDLLRQRRALREFGKDPDEAKVRPAKIVENYEQ